jgi:hypothetical protein
MDDLEGLDFNVNIDGSKQNNEPDTIDASWRTQAASPTASTTAQGLQSQEHIDDNGGIFGGWFATA